MLKINKKQLKGTVKEYRVFGYSLIPKKQTFVIENTTINNITVINDSNIINIFKLKDYSIINRNPASGIVNNPNNKLFRKNTINTLKQPNYVKQIIKQTIPKTTRINYY